MLRPRTLSVLLSVSIGFLQPASAAVVTRVPVSASRLSAGPVVLMPGAGLSAGPSLQAPVQGLALGSSLPSVSVPQAAVSAPLRAAAQSAPLQQVRKSGETGVLGVKAGLSPAPSIGPAGPVAVRPASGSRPALPARVPFRAALAAVLVKAAGFRPAAGVSARRSPSETASSGIRLFDGGRSVRGDSASGRAPRRARLRTLYFNGVELPATAFSDQTVISGRIVKALDALRPGQSLEIALYGIALKKLAQAVIRAHERGVKVRIIMNQRDVWPERKGRTRKPEVDMLIDAGVEMRLLRGSNEFGIMHNKFALFDGRLLVSGSYNWTYWADNKHFENVFFHDDAHRIRGYRMFWDWMWGQATECDPENPPPVPNAVGLLARGVARAFLSALRPAWTALRAALGSTDSEYDKLPPAPRDKTRPVSFAGRRFPAFSFSPRGGTLDEIVKAIGAAQSSIDIAMFSLTHTAIRRALVRARLAHPGIRIRLIFDRGQFRYQGEMRWFAENGFEVYLADGREGGRGVMHHKFMVVDGELVETGSFNYTFNALLNNYENASFFGDPGDAADYAAAFERVLRRAAPPAPDELDPKPEWKLLNLHLLAAWAARRMARSLTDQLRRRGTDKD